MARHTTPVLKAPWTVRVQGTCFEVVLRRVSEQSPRAPNRLSRVIKSVVRGMSHPALGGCRRRF